MNKILNMKKIIFSFLTTTILVLFSCLIAAGTITIEKPNIMINRVVYNNNINQGSFEIIKEAGWPITYDYSFEDVSRKVIIDSEGNIIVTGNTYNNISDEIDFLTVKYNSDGVLIWNVLFNGGEIDYAWDIALDSQDNIVVFGFNSSLKENPNELDLTLFVIKYSKDGIEQWNNTFKWENDCFPGGIAVDSNDNIIMSVGTGDLDGLSFTCLTLKMDSNGNEIWNVTFEEDMLSFGADVVVNSDDEIFVGGLSASFFGQGWFIIKYDNMGTLKWSQRYNEGNQPYDMEIDSEGNLIMTGQDFSSDSNSSSWLTLKCDKNGYLLWKYEYDGINNEYAQDAAIDSKGNIITLGSIVGNDFYEPCLFIYDTNGTEICMKKPSIDVSLLGITVDSDDNIIVTGTINNSVNNYNWDFYTCKFSDVEPPNINIEKPKLGYLYLFDKELFPLLKNTFILGKITVRVVELGTSDVEKVLFYIDGDLMESVSNAPFEWLWDDKSFSNHEIEIHVYDENNNINRETINVWKLF